MEDPRLTETPVSSEIMFQGPILRVEHWQVALSDGSTALRQIAVLWGAAAVVAIDDEGQVILVRQHRVAVGRQTLELPAGKLDSPEEDPLVCARRELSEETGLEAECWQPLTVLETTPGFCTERIHIWLATGLKQGDAHPDEGEFVALQRMPLSKAVELVMNGSIRDGKTVTGILMAAMKRSSDQ